MDEAIEVVSKTCAYTNHTILAEALEKWPINIFQGLLPRIYQIVEEINRRLVMDLREKFPNDYEKQNKMAIINNGMIHMAWLAIHGCFSVNGVAALHTELLKTQELKDWYELYPHKFNNKTNGVTQRRWLLSANPELAAFITSKISKLARKWRKLNLHNNTTIAKEFDMSRVTVGNFTYGLITPYFYDNPNGKITIGAFCSIAEGTKFVFGEHDYNRPMTFPINAYICDQEEINPIKGDIVVEDDVWIGMDSIILSGVTIHQGAVIGAGSVVATALLIYPATASFPFPVMERLSLAYKAAPDADSTSVFPLAAVISCSVPLTSLLVLLSGR